VETDKDGNFVFENVPAKFMNISASKENYMVPPSSFMTHPFGGYKIDGNTGKITLKLSPTSLISGIVHDEQGNPIRGSEVRLFHYSIDPNRRPTKMIEQSESYSTDETGAFKFIDVHTGFYFLIADPVLKRDEHFQWAEKPLYDTIGKATGYVPVRFPTPTAADKQPLLDVGTGENIQANITLARLPLHHVTGIAINSSTASKNDFGCLQIEVSDVDGGQSYISHFLNQTDQQTSILTHNFEGWLPNGNYRLSATCECNSKYESNCDSGNTVSGQMSLSVTDADITGLLIPLGQDNQKIDITIHERKITVCNPDDFACKTTPDIGLISMYEVGLSPFARQGNNVDLPGFGNPQETWKASVKPGAYAFDIQPWGGLYVKSIMSGEQDAIRGSLVIKAGVKADPIQIILDKGGVIDGKIIKDGKQTSGYVYVLPEMPTAERTKFFRPLRVDDKFRVDGCAPGKYLVFATDAQLVVDYEDPKAVTSFLDHWRPKAKEINLDAGKTISVDLEIISARRDEMR
jgi:hypothetical protein